MGFIKTPVKGTNDFLPEDMKLRQAVLAVIRKNYASFGFSEIETPAMEHIENLTGKVGGENEKLIFKIMKRGAELERALADGSEIADSGLRYDLTLPLSRLYSASSDKLPSPFKALQIGNVWRADRPQKGRFRQFTQCDIDILGDASLFAETELVTATASTLAAVFAPAGIKGFTVHINDRRLLSAAAAYAGFDKEEFSGIFITLDKLDKIGKDGVRDELIASGADEKASEKLLSLFDGERSFEDFEKLADEGFVEKGVIGGIKNIIDCAKCQLGEDISLVFDPTLVRGMSYYTGTIFEITIDNYNFSIAGGGRYDEMIGKFSGQKTPACGFSIGFERIITILRDAGYSPEDTAKKTAFLAEPSLSPEKMKALFAEAASLRKDGVTVTVQPLKKNAKFQIDRLMADGYGDIRKIYND